MRPYRRTLRPLLSAWIVLGTLIPMRIVYAADPAPAAPSFYDARMCGYVALRLKDKASYGRWETISIERGSRLSASDRQKEDSRASNMESWLEEDEIRERYAKCQATLAAMSGARPAASGPASVYANPDAPPRFTEADKAEMLKTNDAARFRQLNDKDLAWSAYCLVASESLVQLAKDGPALLGLDPNKSTDVQTAKRIVRQRDELRSLFQLRFKPADAALAREHAQRQLANYRKGSEKHRSTATGMASYVKAQSSLCDNAFLTSLELAR